MNIYTTLRKSSIENEKEVFKDAIHAERTYYNKKRKSQTTLTEEMINFHNKSGHQYESLTDINQQKRSSDKVERWLKKYTSHPREPCVDLDPNVGQVHISSKKMCLRSSGKFNDRENIHSSSENDHIRCMKSTPGTKLNETDILNSRKKKVNNHKNFNKAKIAISRDEINFGHSGKSICTELNENEVILIEDSQETIIEKDNLAYLEVLRFENQKAERENVGGNKTNILKNLQSYIENLRVEIAHLEGEVRPHPLFIKDHKRVWTQHSLMKVLYEHVEQMKYFQNNVKPKKLMFKSIKKRYRSKQICKSKFCKKIEEKKGNKNKRYVGKSSCDISVQTDFQCFCTNLGAGINSEAQMNDHANEDTKENLEHDIIEFDRLSPQQPTLESNRTTYGPRVSISDDSVHNISGSHSVKVQYHAPINLLDSDSSDLENNTKKAITRIQQANENSPPHFWQEQHRTPTKGSPTYTLTPPSNSSSNKENRDPWETPKSENKMVESKKQKKESTPARRPLSKLFEASPAKVQVACSHVNSAQLTMLQFLCGRMGWVYREEFTPEVTHLVVGADDDNKAKRTVKYICAVAASAWVVSTKWVEQCVREDCHLSEESFEVLDWSFEPGPLLSRLDPYKLLSGFTICCLPSVTTIRPDILESALREAGAKTVSARELEGTSLISNVVVLHEPRDDDDIQAYRETVSRWKVTAAVLNYEWALESISRHCVLSAAAYLVPHAHTHASAPHTHEWLSLLCQHDSQQSL